jgi:hypothetical protein
MQTNNILILGRHSIMMQTVISLLLQYGFGNTKGVLTNEEVINELLTRKNHVLVIGGGVDVETRKLIQQVIAENRIQTKIAAHFGNPATLIDEIKQLL